MRLPLVSFPHLGVEGGQPNGRRSHNMYIGLGTLVVILIIILLIVLL